MYTTREQNRTAQEAIALRQSLPCLPFEFESVERQKDTLLDELQDGEWETRVPRTTYMYAQHMRPRGMPESRQFVPYAGCLEPVLSPRQGDAGQWVHFRRATGTSRVYVEPENPPTQAGKGCWGNCPRPKQFGSFILPLVLSTMVSWVFHVH